MNTNYQIDLTLMPTTLDLWHVSLLGAVLLLALILIILLISMVISLARKPKKEPVVAQPVNPVPAEPEVKVVEKIVEVEKIVQAPAPDPVILKEATSDAALQVLGLLQKEARFIDFIKEDITAYDDADIGIAARVVHEGCNKALNQYLTLDRVRTETEGDKVTLEKDFNATEVQLIGNIVGQAPFKGTLVHKGWKVTEINLPKLTEGHNANVIAAAEVEL